MRLYDVSESILAILGEEDAELTPESEEALSALQMEFDAKADAILKYRQGLEAEAEAIFCEYARLKGKSDSLNAKADRLKSLLLREMTKLGVKKISGLVSATVCPSPPKVEVDCVDLDDEWAKPFVRIIPESKELDKKAIIEAYKQDQNVMLPQGVSVKVGTHLRVS